MPSVHTTVEFCKPLKSTNYRKAGGHSSRSPSFRTPSVVGDHVGSSLGSTLIHFTDPEMEFLSSIYKCPYCTKDLITVKTNQPGWPVEFSRQQL